MRWQLTLKDPLNVISPLQLGHFVGAGYDRARVGQTIDHHNAPGRPVITGSSYGYRYLWTLALGLSETDALRLERFEQLQNDRGYLVLDDEFDYVTPEPTPRKTLISGTTRTIDDSTTGFGRFAVWLYFPQDGAPKHWGIGATQPFKKVTLIVHEIPGVTP